MAKKLVIKNKTFLAPVKRKIIVTFTPATDPLVMPMTIAYVLKALK